MAAAGQQTVVTTARTSSKNLLQQLPAGAVLAFQALAATFTNQGNCYHSNMWLTVGLVTVLSATCIFFSFTDSLVFQGKVYYGVAIPGRLNILNMSEKEEKVVWAYSALEERRLKTMDWVHAFFTAVVFLTIAGSDVGLQNCFFPKASDDTRQLLKNLPLGMAVMSSFVFIIFPTTRKGMGFDDSDYIVIPTGDQEDQRRPNRAPEPTTTPSTDQLIHQTEQQ
ncbi:protein DMP3-like [Miscanthus floridulus]|uniref:protein DMP3-like n=1 Tax=Miscanthus floridulus TaxID=154761 RepID=UPI003458F5A1